VVFTPPRYDAGQAEVELLLGGSFVERVLRARAPASSGLAGFHRVFESVAFGRAVAQSLTPSPSAQVARTAALWADRSAC
jgi:hypothetical protein